MPLRWKAGSTAIASLDLAPVGCSDSSEIPLVGVVLGPSILRACQTWRGASPQDLLLQARGRSVQKREYLVEAIDR